MMKPTRPWQLALAFGAACLALVVHFGFTILYALPTNPANVRIRPLLDAYMRPVFSQNWSLFAPNPPYESKMVLVGCRVRGTDGAVEEKPVVNVSLRLQEMNRAFRLTPATYLMRSQLGPLPILFVRKTDLEKRVEEKDLPELEEMRRNYQEYRDHSHAQGIEMMTRVASAECRRLHPGQEVVEVRPMALLESVPKYSQRYQESPTLERRSFDMGWHPYIQVAPL
ncbi:DUF5819 family protein [Myxococcus stipitatus]|uniref:DUF5819 family protein n=1 Tax=Myxococcus stipitatus TaxID=83455 RepID=UPI001F1ABB96|nr:DUF5819 family protein [Myxococcus stipitatus]MCE9667308.1 DUF5819 family protein [Myxococcus stipitatus]